MDERTSQNTSYTLLQRAVDTGDQGAWESLVEHYRRFIFHVLNGLRVAPHDAEDISQQVLLCLTRDLPNYDRSKSRFRTWLSTLIRNISVDHYRQAESQKRRIAGMREAAVFEDMTQTSEIETHIEEEWATYIVSQAMERVSGVFKGQAIKVFELSMDGLSAAEVAERTGLSVASVYTLKKRVKRALFLEIQELTADLEP